MRSAACGPWVYWPGAPFWIHIPGETLTHPVSSIRSRVQSEIVKHYGRASGMKRIDIPRIRVLVGLSCYMLARRASAAKVLAVETEPPSEHQGRAKSALADAVAHARSLLVNTNEPDLPPAKALDALSASVLNIVSDLIEAEIRASREKLKTQAELYETKIETARVAAAVSLEHKAVEVTATCSRRFDEKLKQLSEDGGSLEASLMERIEEQATELKRLEPFEKWLTEAREREAETLLEIEKRMGELNAVNDEVKLCKGLIARSAKSLLDAELASVGEGTIRDVCQEFVAAAGAALGDVKALRAERDDLKVGYNNALEAKAAEAAARAEEAAAREAAEAAAAELEAQLCTAKEAEAAALAQLEVATREISELKQRLFDSEKICAALEEASKALKEQVAKAEAARAEAAAEAERLAEEVATLAKEAAEAAACREREAAALAALAEAEQRAFEIEQRAVETEAALRAEVEGLQAEANAAEEVKRVLEEHVKRSEARAEKAETELSACERELVAAHEEARTLAEEAQRAEERCAAAQRAAEEAEAEAEKKFAQQIADGEAAAADMRRRLEAAEAEFAEKLRMEAALAKALHSVAMLLSKGQLQQAKDELAKLRQGMLDGSGMAELEAELQEVQTQLKSAREQHTAELESMRTQHAADLESLRASLSGGGKHAAEMEVARAKLVSARLMLESMSTTLEANKVGAAADRASLIECTLQSLTQLSDHLANTLAGLRIGKEQSAGGGEESFFQVRSCEPSPRTRRAATRWGGVPSARQRMAASRWGGQPVFKQQPGVLEKVSPQDFMAAPPLRWDGTGADAASQLNEEHHSLDMARLRAEIVVGGVVVGARKSFLELAGTDVPSASPDKSFLRGRVKQTSPTSVTDAMRPMSPRAMRPMSPRVAHATQHDQQPREPPARLSLPPMTKGPM